MRREGASPARIAFYDAYGLSAGAGIALRDLIARIDRERFEPLAVLPRDGPLVGLLRDADCPVEILPPPPPLGVYGGGLPGAGVREKLRAAVALAKYSRAVARWLRRHEVDLLHCNQTRATVTAGPGARLAGVPAVWNVRIRERLPRPAVRIANACSRLIIALTDRDFDDLPDRRRLMRKSTVIPNAVDTERFSPDRDRAAARGRLGVPESVPLIVSVGLLVRRKGFDVLVRAMEWVRSDHPDVRLLIAGDEPDGMGGCREELEALIEELELGECVTLLGHRGDVPELLAACDVFVLASREEGDPAAVLEAMATGLPVLVTEPASAAVEQFVTGLVVRPDDHLCLSQRLSILLAVPSLHDEWGQAGRRVVEARHDLDRMVRRYEEAWESVLGSGG